MQINSSYKTIIKTPGQTRDAFVHRGKVHLIKHSVSDVAIKHSELKHIQRDKKCSHVQIAKENKAH